jgi:hypothetical protein
MFEDSGSVVPAQVEDPDGLDYDRPTGAAELKIFLMPVSDYDRRGWIVALLRRVAHRARPRRDNR